MSENKLFDKPITQDYTHHDEYELILRRPRNHFPTRDLEAFLRMRMKYRYVSSSGRRPVPEPRVTNRR